MDLASLHCQLRDAGELTLSVKVVPKSSRTDFAGFMADGCVKVRVAAAPEKGKANYELCGFLAKQFGVPRTGVFIETGETSSRKRVVIRLSR